jgi:hypothetical protein
MFAGVVIATPGCSMPSLSQCTFYFIVRENLPDLLQENLNLNGFVVVGGSELASADD